MSFQNITKSILGNLNCDEGCDFFSGLFENRISKFLSLAFSWFGSITCIGMLYSIIWYERFGSDYKRTLINRLFVFFWYGPMLWEATVQQVDILRYAKLIPFLSNRLNRY